LSEDQGISKIEKEILARAIEKLNYVYTYGRGESLTEDETLVFRYWKDKGLVRAVSPAPFGEIYALSDERNKADWEN
jgi:hypothetical protein